MDRGKFSHRAVLDRQIVHIRDLATEIESEFPGDADVVLVHAPEAEQRYVDSGDLVNGRLVMHNDFVILGPQEDPARALKLTSVGEVMRAIASRGVFVSRGDESGTHTQELALWAAAGIDPKSLARREETGGGV